MPQQNEHQHVSISFKIGLFLLIFNIPFGLGGAAICGALALRTTSHAFYALLGTIIYAVSWVMFGIGLLLAGKDGLMLSKKIISQFIRPKN